jgi:hypothetical protein
VLLVALDHKVDSRVNLPPATFRAVVKELLQKQVLLGPAPLRRAAAARAKRPEVAWLLRQPRHVRESYVREVLDNADTMRPV